MPDVCNACGHVLDGPPNPESLPDEIRRKLVGREVADVSYAIVDSKLDTVTLHFSGGYSLEAVADQLTFRWRR